MHPKLKGLFWIAAALLFALGLSGAGRLFAKKFPWKTEKFISKKWAPFSKDQLCESSFNSERQKAFEKLVSRISTVYPDDARIPYSIQVVHGGSINAFASLGGKIYIFEGLLRQAESSEELAGVIAHEMEHVKQRHVLEGIFTQAVTVGLAQAAFGYGRLDSQMFYLLLHMRFSRTQESDADRGGLQRLKDAQVDPAGLQRFFRRMAITPSGSVPEFLSDHPSAESRADMAGQYRPVHAVPVLSASEWQAVKMICR